MLHKIIRMAAVSVLALGLSACAQTELASHYAKQVDLPGQQRDSGTYKVGKPYQVGGRWITPKESFDHTEVGFASWYGPGFKGKPTANGEIFDPNKLTAAHRTLQMPSYARVTNLENGRSVVVRINDRGPFKSDRVIDVSKRAAEMLDFINTGTARVRVDVMPEESRKIAAAARAGQNTSGITYVAQQQQPQQRIVQTTSTYTQNVQPVSYRVAENYGSGSMRGNDAARNYGAGDPLPESLRPTYTTPETMRQGGVISNNTDPVISETLSPPQPSALQARDLSVPPTSFGQPQTSTTTTVVETHTYTPAPVAPVASPATVMGGSGLYVQAGSFGVRENAQNLVSRLGGYGNAFVEETLSNGRTLYRVKIGPFQDHAGADAALRAAVNAGNPTARIVAQ